MAIWIRLVDPFTGQPQRPNICVNLCCDDGTWVPLDLLVDTGSDYCVIPIEWVTEYGLKMNLMENHVRSFRTSTGANGYGFRGNLQLQLGGRQYSWPCYFSLPPGTEENQAEDMLETILLAGVRAAPHPAAPANRTARAQSLGAWLHDQFPDLALRPGILGRRGFLEDCEIQINSDWLIVLRRSGWRERRRALWRKLTSFLQAED